VSVIFWLNLWLLETTGGFMGFLYIDGSGLGTALACSVLDGFNVDLLYHLF
jgi:hypothetical protein